MKNFKEKSLKVSNGITLIALVITIIVLLILAGISISMLSGDNSILQKAADAKQTSERAEAKEQAQMDIMEYITDKTANHQDASLDDSKVKDILTGKSYVKNGQPGNDSFFTAKGEYEIPYSELYSTIKNNVDTVDDTKVAEINSKIGTVVTGYSANNFEWQVFYADKSETFLISKTYTCDSSVPLKGKNNENEYRGSIDVKESLYGSKWNSNWLSKTLQNNDNINAKATAYLCDPDNWQEFKELPATYAVGGPTIELFIASWNISQNAHIKIDDNQISEYGYFWDDNMEKLFGDTIIKSDIKNGVYNPGNYYYWIASPDYIEFNGQLFKNDLMVLNYAGNLDRSNYDVSSRSMMPR